MNRPWEKGKEYRPFLLVLLFFSLWLAYRILAPFQNALIFAAILASLLYPSHARLVKLYGGRRNLAAFTVIFGVVFLFLIPALFFISALVNQGFSSIAHINSWINAGNLQRLLDHPKLVEYTEWLRTHLSFIELDKTKLQQALVQIGKNFGQVILAQGASLLGNMAMLVTHFLIMIFVCYYLVRDGDKMLGIVKRLSPLKPSQEDRIIEKIRLVARSAILGSFITAMAQGLVGGIGLAIVGISGLFWGTIMGFCSFVPFFGTALVWIPSATYLLLMGKIKSAIFLVLWCMILVGSIDNFVRPFFMKEQAEMSPFYIFLAIIGGVRCFGLAGIIYGPLILAFAKVMLYIYEVEYKELLENDSEEKKVLP